MAPQTSGQLRHFCIPEGEEILALVAGYFIRLGVWHKRGIEVDRDSLTSAQTYDVFIHKMGLIPQSNWLSKSKPRLRTGAESHPHFNQFHSEVMQRIALVGMWWRPEARDQRGYWDINPVQGAGCFLMNDNQAVFGGFPIHLSLLETPRKSWEGLINALNTKYPGCRLGYIPYKAYYPAESSSEYLPAIVWPEVKNNIKLVEDICIGCEEIERILSNGFKNKIDDWRWESIELLWKRGIYWSKELRYRDSWLSVNKLNIGFGYSNPMHGKRTPAAWVDLICSEWKTNGSLSENHLNINMVISRAEGRPVSLSVMTISRIIDRYLENGRMKKPFLPRGTKDERAIIAINAKKMKENGQSASTIAEHLSIPKRRVYRLLESSLISR